MSGRSQNHRGRFYDADGNKYPSVTTILSCVAKPALTFWSANVERAMVTEAAGDLYESLKGNPISKMSFLMQLSERIGKKKANQKLKEKAGEIGTQVHKLIEWTLRMQLCQKVGPSPEIGPEAQIAYLSWEQWRKSVNLRPISVESTVVSHKHKYAGTMDYLCAEVNGVETLCDWKTGKKVYYEAHLQNAAYRVAIREMGIADPKQGLILRLPKTKDEPGFEAVPAREEESCFEVFLACKTLWQDMQKVDKWLKEQDEKVEEAVA
jgi:hypothetical protein